VRASSTGSIRRYRAPSPSPSNKSSTSPSVRRRSSSQPVKPLTLAEKIALGPQLNPWNCKNANPLKKYSARSTGDLFENRTRQSFVEAERREQRLHQIRLDGSRSGGSSPSISRTNSAVNLPRIASWNSFAKGSASSERSGLLKRTNTGDSTASSRSWQSTNSRRSTLSRILTAERNDRNAKGHETRQEQQLRGPGIGTYRESDSTPNGGQGFGGLSGKHAEKSTRWVYSHFCANLLV